MESSTPRIDLTHRLSDQSRAALVRVANEFNIEIDDVSDVRYLCWLVELLKHLRDNSRNFPKGKYATIRHLEGIIEEAAKRVANIYYGQV